MSTTLLTPAKCTALAVLGGVGLAATAGVLAGGAAVAAPVAALGGVLCWLGGMAGGHVQSWFGSKLKNPPPDADEVFRNHHIRQILSQALISTVEKLVPIAKDKLGAVSQTFIDSGKTLAKRLETLIDSPSGTLAQVREFNVTAILTNYATKQGRIELLSEQDWQQFIDEVPDLKALPPQEHLMLVSALQKDFGEALWNLVKHDAATDRQAFAAVELLYLSQILESVQTIAETPPPDLSPIITRIDQLLGEVDQKHVGYFHSILSGINALTGKVDALLGMYGTDRLEIAASLKQTETSLKHNTVKLDSLSSTILSSTPVCRYLANLTRRYAEHNTFGLPAFEAPGQKQEADRIVDIFVQPTCTPGRTSPEAMEAALLEGKNPATALLPLLEKERRVVLLADPGMGKSTLVQWLVVALAATNPSREAARFGRAIPFPFLLRDIVPALGNDLSKWTWQALMEAFLAHKAGGSATDPALAAPLVDDPATLRTVLESPQAWFLLDGLDEIGDPKRRLALQKVVWEGFKLYPGARWLITSRVVGYDEAPVDKEVTAHSKSGGGIITEAGRDWMVKLLLEAGVPIEEAETIDPKLSASITTEFVKATLLHLAPWDDTQQRDFSHHWFMQRLGLSQGEKLARDFITDVRVHASTRVLGRVPNLLLLMGLLYRYRAHLPNGRALVYQGISQAYLEGIPVHRKIPHRTDKVVVPYTFVEKERLLAIIAMHMQKRRSVQETDGANKTTGEILATQEDLTTWLGSEFGGRADRDGALELTDFLKHIAESSGLLLPRAPGVFGFAHLSFQEYYAACYLKLEFERLIASRGRARKAVTCTCSSLNPLTEDDFETWAAQPVWREPLLFLVELLKGSEPFTAEVMAWLFPSLLAEPSAAPESFQAQRLLATLSIDPETALTMEERQSLWTVLCQAHLKNDANWITGESIAPALLERSEYQIEVFSTLISLAAQQKAQRLSLSDCTGMSDLPSLRGLGSLQWLDLSGCTGLSVLTALQGLGSLQWLNLSGCTGVSDLTTLRGLSRLQALSLSGCTGVSDLRALKDLDLRALTGLNLSSCTGLNDLAAVDGFRKLTGLNLSGCMGVRDLTLLQGLTRLQRLDLRGCTGLKDRERQIEDLRKALPKCRIIS
jgi:internalin A